MYVVPSPAPVLQGLTALLQGLGCTALTRHYITVACLLQAARGQLATFPALAVFPGSSLFIRTAGI